MAAELFISNKKSKKRWDLYRWFKEWNNNLNIIRDEVKKISTSILPSRHLARICSKQWISLNQIYRSPQSFSWVMKFQCRTDVDELVD